MRWSCSPLHPMRMITYNGLISANIREGKYDLAAEFGETASLLRPSHPAILVMTIAAQEMNGNHARAAYWTSKLPIYDPDSNPDITMQHMVYPDAEIRGKYQQAWAAHGLI